MVRNNCFPVCIAENLAYFPIVQRGTQAFRAYDNYYGWKCNLLGIGMPCLTTRKILCGLTCVDRVKTDRRCLNAVRHCLGVVMWRGRNHCDIVQDGLIVGRFGVSSFYCQLFERLI